MDIKSILESLERTDSIWGLLTLTPIVGPGAVISNNLEWSSRFREGRAAFYNGEYAQAAQIFRELNEDIPRHDKFLTPARINETLCWSRLGRFAEYIQQYEPLVTQNKVYGGVALWTLVVGYCRTDNTIDAEACLKKWLEYPASQHLGKGYLLLSILQFHNGKTDEAISSFNNAWETDEDFCRRVISKRVGYNMVKALPDSEVHVEVTPKKELRIVAKDEVLSALQELLVSHAPGKYPQIVQQLSEFEYHSGYIAALEKFGDGDVDGALKLIESLIKGSRETEALLWAKADCLLAKRKWGDAIALVKCQLDDPGIPGGVLWNATCAYFNLGEYDLALNTSKKCTEAEYQTSPMAWLVQGLLSHICGNSSLRNSAIKEAGRIAGKISSSQLNHYIGLIKQIGVDLEELPSEEGFQISKVEDEQLVTKYNGIAKNARTLLNKGKPYEAANEFVQLSPESIADIPEVGDTTFKPLILPTCPARLYDYKDIFLSGVTAFQREAYEEAVQKFEDLYLKTDRSYPVAVNLASALIFTEKYSRAIDILLDIVERREYGGAYAIRNLISAFMKSERLEDAFLWFSKLLETSDKEYFNFVQMAYVAQLIGRKEDAATALFNACTINLAEPSIRLKGAAVRACLEVKDYDRAVALLKYFVKETQPPYVVAAVKRPIMPASDCKIYSQMYRQYQKFTKKHLGAIAALAYFQEVHSAREADYGTSIDTETVNALFSACVFYGQSLFQNQEFDKAHEILGQAFGILTDHSNCYKPRELSKRYSTLTKAYFDSEHYFWAQELCERGLEADSENNVLSKLQKKIEQKIEEIPDRSREAIKELAELPMSATEKTADFIGLLPKVSPLIDVLPHDFAKSRRVIKRLEDLINDLIRLESVSIVDRKKEIVRQRDTVALIERDLPLYLPRTFISALLPVLKGIRKTLEDVQSKSICPEFDLVLEPVSYYIEREASLVYKLRNIGAADVHKLRIKMAESDPSQGWAPAWEMPPVEIVKKDETLWIDWPIYFDSPPEPESVIKPQISLYFTGGSLGGEFAEQVIDYQETKLEPFMDLSVGYPVVALRPEESNKLYGRENLLRTLKTSFTRSVQNRIPFLVGVRKVGKTSILYFLSSRLTDSSLSVYVNMDTGWTNPYQLFAKRISEEIVSRIGMDLGDLSQIVTRDNLNHFLANAKRSTGITHIVLLLDEFHVVIDRIEEGSISSGFLGDLRDMYQGDQRIFSVAFADWYSIDELKSRVRAQLWADFALEPVSFLNELDTREAILSPAQGLRLNFEQDVVSRIYYWTNGYPWHIQWICSDLIDHLNTQKRYVAIPQDIDLIVQKLLINDYLFDEGICRPERLSRNSQSVIYEILETIQKSKGDICSYFDREIITNMRLPFDANQEVERMIQLEILLKARQTEELRFCSPLHAKWFEAKRQRGADVYGKSSGELSGHDEGFSITPIPEDPVSEISRKCERLKYLKSQLRTALDDEHQIFKNFEMPGEWDNACTVVCTQETWDVFIKALRNLFVEDMKSRLLKEWNDRKRYPDLNSELHSIRRRRNYVQHLNDPDNLDGKKEEERCCVRDIGKKLPTSTDEWLILQLKAIDRLIKAIETAIEQNAIVSTT